MNGLYSLQSPISRWSCTTGKCTWPTYCTLGICSSCYNVTDGVNSSCVRSPGSLRCHYTFSSGFELFASSSSSSGGGHRTTFNSTTILGETGFGTNITNTLVRIAMIKMNYDYDKEIGTIMRPDAMECDIAWCAKAYRNTIVTDGQWSTSNVSEYELQSPFAMYNWNGREYNPFNVVKNDSEFNGNRTFTVNGNDHNTMSSYLAELFTTSDQDATARALTLSLNITATMYNIATSMTTNIRQGSNATEVSGFATLTETYIHVNWFWLLLPSIVVITGSLLLIFSIILSSSGKVQLWKSSSLALLFSYLQGWDSADIDVDSPAGLSRAAGEMKGKLVNDEYGGLRFVKERSS